MTTWKATAIWIADQSPSGLRRSASGPVVATGPGRRSASATSSTPAASGGARNGSNRRATSTLSSRLTTATRGSSTVHAATTPSPSEPASAGCRWLSREKCSVTAVDEMRPPSRPVTP